MRTASRVCSACPEAAAVPDCNAQVPIASPNSELYMYFIAYISGARARAASRLVTIALSPFFLRLSMPLHAVYHNYFPAFLNPPIVFLSTYPSPQVLRCVRVCTTRRVTARAAVWYCSNNAMPGHTFAYTNMYLLACYTGWLCALNSPLATLWVAVLSVSLGFT